MRHFVQGSGAILICLPVVFTGCGRPATGQQKREPPKVTVALPVVKDVIDEAEFTGWIEPQEFVEIRARVKGTLEKIEFKPGTVVNQGTPLFRIQQDVYQANLAAAVATKAQTVAARDLAKAKYERYKGLHDRDDTNVTLEELQTYAAELAGAEARIQFDDASIEKAQIELSYTEIAAPTTGLMGRARVDVGNLVGAGENTLLTTIVKMNPMYVYFDVPSSVVQQYLAKRRANEGPAKTRRSVFVGLEDEGTNYPHQGEIDFIDNRINKDTGTAQVRGVLENKSGYLYDGQFARVKVPLDPLKDAITVEEEALGSDLDGKYLLVVGPNNIVEQRPVETGALIDGMRVLRKAVVEKVKDKDGVEQETIVTGILPSELYIVDGLQRARPGMPVEPEEQAKAENGKPKAKVNLFP